MIRAFLSALALLLAAGPNASAQTAAAPAGQTPQANLPGAAPTAASQTAPTTQTGAAASHKGLAPQSASPRPRARGARTPSALRGTATPQASDAPVANSRVVITGSNSTIGKPNDDHPMLPMAAVGNPLGIRSGTPIRVQLQKTADSGNVRNGDVLNATLVDPVGGLAKGTPVQLTVVQSTQAGTLSSAGELSVQVTRIGNYNVLSVIVTAFGKDGKRDIADAAPARGTEAEFAANQPLSFPAA